MTNQHSPDGAKAPQNVYHYHFSNCSNNRIVIGAIGESKPGFWAKLLGKLGKWLLGKLPAAKNQS